MHLRLSLLVATGLLSAAPAYAQQPASANGAANGTIATSTPGLDISRLPVNLGRIGRQLRQTESREQRDGLKLHYVIDVYGEAPKIQLITPLDNLLTGSVPNSAPTHNEMIRMMTPREFSTPVISTSLPRRK
jgi:hypothetical protein